MTTLNALHATLTQTRSGQTSISVLAQQFREAMRTQQPALPPRYHEVLERILTQLESSAFFSEESCSFSQADLLTALGDWLDKAEAAARNAS